MKKIEKLKKKGILLDGFRSRVLHENPYIVKIKNFISDDEIQDLKELAKGRFEKSNVALNGELVLDKMRTSSTAYLMKDGLPEKYSKNIEKLIRRIRYLVGCERDEIEGLMMVRYRTGEKFETHVDYFEENEIGVFDQGGQRIITFFVYLNTLSKDEGGETEFTRLGIRSHPVKGDAIFFVNQDPETKEMLPDTMHRGNPVTKEGVTKYGLNIWIRDRSFF